MATPTEPARKQRMVLCLSHNGIFKRVAVPFDKDLGSPETSAEVARAFGSAATSIESLTISCWLNGHGHHFEHVPLNLNGYDFEHPFQKNLREIVFEKCTSNAFRACDKHFYLDVKFNTVPGRRPSASEDPKEAFAGFQEIEGPRPFVFGK